MKTKLTKAELQVELEAAQKRIAMLERAVASGDSQSRAGQFHPMFNSCLEGIQIVDFNWRYLYVNAEAEKHTRHSGSELVGNSFMDVWIGVETTQIFSVAQECMDKRTAAVLDDKFVFSDGTTSWFEISFQPIPEGMLIASIDVTQHKQANEELYNATRALRMLNESSQMLLRSMDENSLLQGVCQTIVETGGYCLAWVGYAENDEAKTVRPVAQAGYADGYLGTLRITWADNERGRGPTGTAIRAGSHIISNNILTDAKFAPWRDDALKRGYASSIALPLKNGERVIGALNIYSSQPNAFLNPKEQDLLLDLAADLSYRVSVLRMQIEHTRATEDLRWAEEKYRQLFENSLNGIFQSSPEGRILIANPALARMWGYESPEALIAAVVDIGRQVYVDPNRRFEFMRLLDEQDYLSDFEYQSYRRDGSVMWNSVYARAVRDQRGALLYYEGAVEDITRRKQAEELLRQSREQYALAIEGSNDGIWDWDIISNQTYFSPRWKKMLGYEDAELENNFKTWEKLLYPDDRERVLTALQDYLAERNSTYDLEFRLRHKGGDYRWIRGRGKALRNQNGQPYRMAGSHTDITERKWAEGALRIAENNYRNLVENTPALVYLDKVVGKDAATIYVSPKTKDILGYSPEVFLENPYLWRELVLPDDLDRVLSSMDVILKEGGSIQEYRMIARDDRQIWLRDTSVLLRDKNGDPEFIQGFMEDITAQKQTEMELQKRVLQLALINEVGQKIASILDLQGVLDVSAQLIHEVFGYYHVAFFALDKDADELVMKSRAGQLSQVFPETHRIKLGEGMVGITGESGQLILANHVSDEPAYKNYLPEILSSASELSLPIKMGGEVVGVLDVQSPQLDAFSPHDLTVLKTIADQVAIALENARLVADLEQRVRERTAELQDLYDNAPIGYHSLDRHGKFVMVNHTELNWLGYQWDEVVGRSFEDFLAPHNRSRFDAAFAKFKQEGSVKDAEVDFIRKDGSILPVVLNAVGMYDDAGRFVMSRSTILDNTERKKIEDALRHREQEFTSLVENSPDLVARFDTDLRYTYCSPIFERLGSRPISAYLGKTILEVGARKPESVIVLDRAARQALETGEIQQVEHNLLTRFGFRYYQTRVIPERNKDGRIVSLLSVGHDITEHKQLEDALREAKEFAENLIQTANVMFVQMNKRGEVVRLNREAEHITGYTQTEVNGQNWLEILMPRERYPDIWEVLDRSLQTGELPDVFENSIIAKSGEERHIIWKNGVVSAAGEHVGLISFGIDITGRKQAEQELRQSEEQNRLLFEESPDAVVLVDSEAHIVRINRAYEALARIPREKMIGRAANELGLIDDQTVEQMRDHVMSAMSAGENFPPFQYIFTSADGVAYNLEGRIFLLLINSKPHILVTNRDISAHRQAEETLRLANIEMERALRMKDEFLANMSHELRTPLNAILGITESLSEQIAGSLSDKQLHYVSIVHESGQHLLNLINDILDLAKIEAGKITLEFASVKLSIICESSLRMVRELAQKKNQNLSFNLDSNLGLIWADERRLKQILVNLLSNAVKFTPEGGRVGLDVHGDMSQHQIVFTVWDTGAGIKPEALQLLFKPFVQLDSGLNREYSGTGLGLALVSEMTRMHGGSVRVESQPGKGSRFIVALPWEVVNPLGTVSLDNNKEALIQSPNTIDKNRRRTILLVEDTANVIMIVQEYLKFSGYQVVVANNGMDGVAAAKHVMPDLILMDVQMPVMNGLEATRKIRADLELQHIPIVALTALAMPGDRERCLAAGMNEYVSKPIALKELTQVVERLLNPDIGA